MLDGEAGIWHLANEGRVSWHEFGRRIAVEADLDDSLVVPSEASSLGWHAPRPGDVALGSERGQMLPKLDHAIERFAESCRTQARAIRTAGVDIAPAMRPN
jgi:dTDP-4-dehydrorhamnose reductase